MRRDEPLSRPQPSPPPVPDGYRVGAEVTIESPEHLKGRSHPIKRIERVPAGIFLTLDTGRGRALTIQPHRTRLSNP